MYGRLKENKQRNSTDNETIYPVFFKLSDPIQKDNLFSILEDQSIFTYDRIIDQVKELIKTRHPEKKLTELEITEKINIECGGQILEEYGIWVYYPWSKRLVHILDGPEFIELRTNRNIYKITEQERNILSKKKVGVIGLSVGQSVSLTMATERSFGEIRIADFDTLDLSNLNRIRSGVHNIGISKVVLTAREIAEIDPFLKVTCFHGGISEENIDAFIHNGGTIDVLIDECDSVEIKILCREKARSYNIPVIMEASDRGTLDIERFDLEKNRPLFHGNAVDISTAKLKNLSNEDKIPFILPIAGIDTLSTRMKASMIEVGKTIYTWPQLASAVVLGGAISADVYRRIALNQIHCSGRFFIDLEQLISDSNNLDQEEDTKELTVSDSLPPFLHNLSIHDHDALQVNKVIIEELINSAHQAPSIGNSQPWRWHYFKGKLILYFDKSSNLSFGDFNGMGAFLSLGCGIENLKIASMNKGLKTNIIYFPQAQIDDLVAVITFSRQEKEENNHYKFISFRATNRRIVQTQPISKDILIHLSKAVGTNSSTQCKIIDDTNKITTIAEIAGECERIRLLNPAGHQDFFKNEIKWNSEQWEADKKGIYIESLELSPIENAGLQIARDEKSIALLREWNLGTAFGNITYKSILAASAIGIITIQVKNSKAYVNAGESLQKLWLEATANRISFHPILAPIFLFNKVEEKDTSKFTSEEVNKLWDLRKKFISVFEVDQDHAIFLFRLFIDPKQPNKSLRRPLDEILSFGE